MNPAAPILIFDSGVGGLTILAEVRKTLPEASVIYAADFAGLPYGTKSEAEVAARVCGLLGRMAERYQPRLVCIACNTASTIALGMVRDVLAIPIVGTVPAIKPAAKMTRTGVIGLLGQVLLTAALRYGMVANVIVMDYSGLVWATLFGWLVFSNLPPASFWIGAPLVVGAGLLIAWREHRLGLARRALVEPKEA